MADKKESKKDPEVLFTVNSENLWKILTVVFAVLFVISLFTGGFGIGSDGNNVAPTNTGNTGGTTTTKTATFSIGDDPVKGDENAPVTIYEWSDYECPFCGRFYSDSLGQIESKYINTGKAKLVFKDLPLSIHPDAQPAASAANCAGEQGKYWEYHNALFENQNALSDSLYTQIATQLGLDLTEFNSCRQDSKWVTEARADTAEGSQNGVTGTPGFLIVANKEIDRSEFAVLNQYPERNVEYMVDKDGNTVIKVSGALPFDAFDSILSAMQ